jgi:tRNA pseudouridine55 synthase
MKLGKKARVGVDGILNILKPPGKTSFQVVSLVQRLSGEKRVGHAGTLDPEATGVLILCLGQGTRIIQFLAGAAKTYRAEIELGITTDTYDASGKITQRRDPSLATREQVKQVLDSLCGSIEQIPPMYSAIRYKGKRLYQLARQGIEVPRKPRMVQIFRLEFLEWQPPFITIEVECSAGTYIRSLAQDIGQTLGYGAYLRRLVRLKSAPFHIAEAIPLSLIEEAFHQGYWQCFLYSIDEVILNWGAVILSKESEMNLSKGCPLSLGTEEKNFTYSGDRCRAYSIDGRFLAVLRFQEVVNLWHPEKVFHNIA